jgi:hypothetical protein
MLIYGKARWPDVERQYLVGEWQDTTLKKAMLSEDNL